MTWPKPTLFQLCNFLTAPALWVTLLGAPLVTHSAPLCSPLFLETTDTLVPIAMSPLYKGEEKGTYIDPLTQQAWRVKYYTPMEKTAFEVTIKEGRLVDLNGQKANTLFDPDSMSFEHHLFIVDQQLRIFILPFEERGKFHHSSLSAGENILFAGTLGLHQGVLRELSDKSGHYRPDTQQTLKVLKLLQNQGLDLSQTKLYGYAAQEIGKSHILTSGQLKEVLFNLPEVRHVLPVPAIP